MKADLQDSKNRLFIFDEASMIIDVPSEVGFTERRQVLNLNWIKLYEKSETLTESGTLLWLEIEIN